MYWNLSSLKDITTEVYKSKIRIIRKHIASGPVLLAETKWDEAHPMRIAQELSGAVMFFQQQKAPRTVTQEVLLSLFLHTGNPVATGESN